MKDTDWTSKSQFPAGLPFGGATKVRFVSRKRVPPLSVRIQIDRRTEEEEFREDMRDQDLGELDFEFLRRRSGKFYGFVSRFTTGNRTRMPSSTALALLELCSAQYRGRYA